MTEGEHEAHAAIIERLFARLIESRYRRALEHLRRLEDRYDVPPEQRWRP